MIMGGEYFKDDDIVRTEYFNNRATIFYRNGIEKIEGVYCFCTDENYETEIANLERRMESKNK